jgi:hypothetical protein
MKTEQPTKTLVDDKFRVLKEYVRLMSLHEQEFRGKGNTAGQNEAWYSVGRADGYKTMCKFLKELIER